MSSFEFAMAARLMGQVIRSSGYRAPAFRSPPRVVGQNRSIRRRPDGSASIAVALRGRAQVAVVADMIDGVVAANRLHGVASARLRDDLWDAVCVLVAPEVMDTGSSGHRAA